MDKLAQYKKAIRARCGLLIFLVGIFFLALALSIRFGPQTDETLKDGILSGFQVGMSVGFFGVAVFLMVRYGKALSNPDFLKKLYLDETDERKSMIRSKCGASAMLPCACIILLGAVISGYFSFTVFCTLLACSAFLLTVMASLKLYYLKKY